MRPGKKLHAPVGVPPSGLLTSLRLLVQCVPPATTRRTGRGGRRGGGKEGRRKREGEGKGEKGERRKEERRRGKGEEGSGIQAHLGCLLVGGVTTGSSLSAIWSATLYPPRVPHSDNHLSISVFFGRDGFADDVACLSSSGLPSTIFLDFAICFHQFYDPFMVSLGERLPDCRQFLAKADYPAMGKVEPVGG